MKNQKIIHLNILLIFSLFSSKITSNFPRRMFSGVFGTGLIVVGLKQYLKQCKPRFMNIEEQELEQFHLDIPNQSRFDVTELNKYDVDEIQQVCALFEDKKNRHATSVDPEYMLHTIASNKYKTFVCKTKTVPPVVVGILRCMYLRNGLDEYFREIKWNDFTPAYKKTDKDAICYATIAVHPQYRRQGVATALMQRADKFCIDFGMNNIVISAIKSNINAIDCYIKQGFKPLSEGLYTKKLYKEL